MEWRKWTKLRLTEERNSWVEKEIFSLHWLRFFFAAAARVKRIFTFFRFSFMTAEKRDDKQQEKSFIIINSIYLWDFISRHYSRVNGMEEKSFPHLIRKMRNENLRFVHIKNKNHHHAALLNSIKVHPSCSMPEAWSLSSYDCECEKFTSSLTAVAKSFCFWMLNIRHELCKENIEKKKK